MKKILLAMLLFLVLTHGVFSLGRKDQGKPDKTDKQGTTESVLFGLVEITKGDKAVIKIGSGDAGQTVYTVIGNKKKEIEDAVHKYIFVKGKLVKEKDPKINVSAILVIQDSTEPDWSKAQYMVIEGLIELGKDDQVCIVTNPDSRSRVSHYVFGTNKNKIRENIGRLIKVEGYGIVLKEDETPFIKEIIVEKIHLN